MSAKEQNKISGAVPGTFVKLLFDYLERKGIDAQQLLGQPAPRDSERSLARYPIIVWREMLLRASEHLNDPLLSLHLGCTITPAHFGVMGYIFLNCGTVGASLLRFQEFQRLLHDANPSRHWIEKTSVILEWGIEDGRPGALVDETAIVALIQFVRDMTEKPLAMEEVHFVNPTPTDVQPYRDFFRCPVHFEKPTTRVKLPATHLGIRLRHPDTGLLAVLESQAQDLLAQLKGSGDLEHAVRGCIARLARSGEPSLDGVANELHLSVRTLRRRLEELNLGFRDLREDTRRRLAEDYLRDSRLGLSEIAKLLGFSEQSAFNRAFRRWTDSSPSEFRRKVGH